MLRATSAKNANVLFGTASRCVLVSVYARVCGEWVDPNFGRSTAACGVGGCGTRAESSHTKVLVARNLSLLYIEIDELGDACNTVC